MNFECFKCSSRIRGEFKDLTRHFRHSHAMLTSNQTTCQLICGQNGCKKEFKTVGTFRYHVLWCVRQVDSRASPLLANSPHNDLGNRDLTRENPISVNSPHSPSDDVSDVTTPVDPNVNASGSLMVAIALIMLNLRAHHNVSHAAIDYLVNGVKEAINENLMQNEEGSSDENVKLLVTGLESLKTRQLRYKFYEKNMGYVKPEEMLTGKKHWVNRVGKFGRMIKKQVHSTF